MGEPLELWRGFEIRLKKEMQITRLDCRFSKKSWYWYVANPAWDTTEVEDMRVLTHPSLRLMYVYFRAARP